MPATVAARQQRDDLRRRLPRVIGHRGASLAAPENTLAGVRAARAQGATWVEVDVKLSADGVPFLLHDPVLKRTTSGRGKARRWTMAALRTLDAGSWFSKAYVGERLPTLQELIAALVDLDMGLNLEIKPCPGRDAETARRIVDELRRSWPAQRPPPLLSSFSLAALAAATEAAPDLPRGLIAEKLPHRWRQTIADFGLASLHLGHEHLRPGHLEAVLDEGVPVLAWTVNDPVRAGHLLKAGVAALITDAPGRLLAALAADPEPATGA